MPFICVIDTICQGSVASWKDEEGRPVVYDTEAEAMEDACDPEMLAMGNDPDEVIPVTVTDMHIIGLFDGRVYWTKGQAK